VSAKNSTPKPRHHFSHSQRIQIDLIIMTIAKKGGISWMFRENMKTATIYGNDLFHKFMKYPRKIAFLSYNHDYEINSMSLIERLAHLGTRRDISLTD
jgi:hypothetical protein